jgi:hypothetical protein
MTDLSSETDPKLARLRRLNLERVRRHRAMKKATRLPATAAEMAAFAEWQALRQQTAAMQEQTIAAHRRYTAIRRARP